MVVELQYKPASRSNEGSPQATSTLSLHNGWLLAIHHLRVPASRPQSSTFDPAFAGVITSVLPYLSASSQFVRKRSRVWSMRKIKFAAHVRYQTTELDGQIPMTFHDVRLALGINDCPCPLSIPFARWLFATGSEGSLVESRRCALSFGDAGIGSHDAAACAKLYEVVGLACRE